MTQDNKTGKYILYVGSLISYIVALNSPLFVTQGELFGFSFSKEEITFFRSITILAEHDRWLSYALLLFVVVLPSIKYFVLILKINGVVLITDTVDNFLIHLQKYAMTDVFVIALLLICLKPNPLFHLEIDKGTYALTLSVLMSFVLSLLVLSSDKYSSEN